MPKDLPETVPAATAAEADGYDGLWVTESKHDPFLQVLQATSATSRITVGTSVAIAFARSPMTTAASAYDLAQYSQGRFILGLGSQIKPHVERRFSMPWSRPAARMREYVLALRAIWGSWTTGERLNFDGEFYTHTLMTPFFVPHTHQWGPPPVYLAGVGERMTETAGEVADGFLCHPFTTSRYLSEVTVPALRRGRARRPGGADSLDGFVLASPAFVTVGRDAAELAVAVAGTKRQIAFYGSTPGYRAVLDLHGWGDLQPELTRLTKEGRWEEMGGLISDEMLAAFSVAGSPKEVAAGLADRWGGVVERIALYATYEADPAIWGEVAEAMPAAG